jgi:hypothetical protein
MHLITLYTPCIALVFMAHLCIFAIDHAEHELEEPLEPVLVETADFEQDQGKPRYI